jgi:hypothetical protein
MLRVNPGTSSAGVRSKGDDVATGDVVSRRPIGSAAHYEPLEKRGFQAIAEPPADVGTPCMTMVGTSMATTFARFLRRALVAAVRGDDPGRLSAALAHSGTPHRRRPS